MMRYDSRAPRYSKTWLGLLLGGTCLVAGGGVAAMSVTTGPRLPELILVQDGAETAPVEPAPGAAAARSFTELQEALAVARGRLEKLSQAAQAVAAPGRLRDELTAVREENQQLVAEIEALRGGDQELQSSKASGRSTCGRVVSQALEEASARAREVDEELVAVVGQHAQLNTSLTQTRAAREEDRRDAQQTQEALTARIAALEAAGEQTATVMARLREQLEESEHELMAASGVQAEAERQLAEMSARVAQAEQNAAQAGDRLAAVQEQLSAAREQAFAAQQDRGGAEQRVAGLASELRSRLATVTAQLEQTAVVNDRLESQVAELREAAGMAIDAARQNLLAVEQQIKELNTALGAIAPTADPATPGPSPAVAAADEPDHQASANPPAAAVSGERNGGLEAAETAASQADADLKVIKAATAPNRTGEADKSGLLSALSLEQRLHVQGLVADLDATVDDERLTMIVPGGVLFAVNSDEVQDSAHDTLAQVAELINTYGDREVRIVGHTSGLGDSAYNQQLSERRAGSVKQFFVDNFDVEEARLSTEGLGEARPIASNATPEGRRANRRVEVLIRN